MYRSKPWRIDDQDAPARGGQQTARAELSGGHANDAPMAELLLNDLPAKAHVLADKGYDADWIRDLIQDQDCTPHIPPRRNRYDGITYSEKRYKDRNLIERCFNKLKQYRHIAMRSTATRSINSL